jgi:hypothetical protein
VEHRHRRSRSHLFCRQQQSLCLYRAYRDAYANAYTHTNCNANPDSYANAEAKSDAHPNADGDGNTYA